jgi:Uma2 family endonuclease
MSTQPKPYITPEQYLEIERAAEYKSEYFDGEMVAMSGGTLNHATVIQNLNLLLGNQLRGRSCRLVSSDLRLRTNPRGPYFYPDIVVFCGKPQLADPRRDTITDATVVIEVLSPSTERYDRTFKLDQYRRLPSLTDYITISQDRVHIRQNTRRADGSWEVRETSDRDAVIELASIGCSFRVGDAYEQVEFEPEPEA